MTIIVKYLYRNIYNNEKPTPQNSIYHLICILNPIYFMYNAMNIADLFNPRVAKPSDAEAKELAKELYDELHWIQTLSPIEQRMLHEAEWKTMCRCWAVIAEWEIRCEAHKKS